MDSPAIQLNNCLKRAGINFFVSVPCKLLADLITLLERDADIFYTPVTREEEGIGVLAGAFLGGKRPAIVLQNSGLGNSINAICSLLNYYRIPVVFVVSHRGTEGEKIDAQRPMGEATKALLTAAQVPWYEVHSPAELSIVPEKIADAYAEQRSAAFLFSFGFWQG